MKSSRITSKQKAISLALGIISLSGFLLPVRGQQQTGDRPGVPYFRVTGNESAASLLPLKSISADIRIAGVIAWVTVKQVYYNSGDQPIEAVYVFPGSTRAAVHALQMKVGERSIEARIMERAKARQDYNDALNNGQTAALLEQERPNVFQMNVGNILPGDNIEVELQYTEMLVPLNGIYEFVYPTVVGPRYTSSSTGDDAGNEWNANPYTHEGELPLYDFSLSCTIQSGSSLHSVKCPSHNVNVRFSNKSMAQVTLSDREIKGANRDFILKYRLAGDAIESGVWLFSDATENFFMATVQPPAQVQPEMIPPREYIFIVDVSGSMHGFPLQVSNKLIGNLLRGLTPADRFNIIFFAGGSTVLSESSLPVTDETIAKAMHMLNAQSGGGGTELLPALRTALEMKASAGFSRTFVIATDGYVTVEKEAFALIRSNLAKANFFAFGIGTSVNRFLIEGLAHAGRGEAAVVSSEKEARIKSAEFLDYISTPLLTGIRVHFKDFDAYDTEPSQIPDLFRSRPVVIMGKYKGAVAGSVTISGTTGLGPWEQTIHLSTAVNSPDNKALRYLWARERIRMTDDYAGGSENIPENVSKQVMELGLKYHLLTAYTSFVAVDSEVRNTTGNKVKVRQPLPLPEGVSNYAIGQTTGSSQSFRKSAPPFSVNSSEISMDEKSATAQIFTVNESPAAFKGGETALKAYLKNNLQYPQNAATDKKQGFVTVEFTVDIYGKIKGVRILKSDWAGFNNEALRLVQAMPDWIPASRNGSAYASKINLRIWFAWGSGK